MPSCDAISNEVLEDLGRYVRVRRCDYLSSDELTGWAPRKYFRKIAW